MTNGKLRVAIIGAGDMGNTHAKIWTQTEGVEIVAVSDLIESRAKTLSENFNVPVWTTKNEEAYGRDDVDIVSVCIPSSEHSSIVIPALELNKHVLSEKSIARTLDDANRVVDAVNAAKKRGLKYTVSFQRRFQPIRQRQAELIQNGVLGRPLLMQTSFINFIRPKLAMHDMWVNGGPAIDMGVHQYDYWRTQFNAEPIQVIARGFTYGTERPELEPIKEKAPDTLITIVTFDSGDVGVMTICWGLPPGWKGKADPELLIGPAGTLTKQAGSIIISGEGGKVETIAASGGDERIPFFRNFADCILEDKQPWISAEDGLAALEVGIAVLESLANEGKPVQLHPERWAKRTEGV